LFVFLIGFLAFCRTVFNWNYGLENILYREDDHTIGTLYPGLMALSTSINFMLIALALILLTSKRRAGSLIIHFCAVFAATLSVFTLLGYITGIQQLAGPGSFSKMAIHTAILFILLSSGTLAAVLDNQAKYTKLELRLFAGITVSVAIILFVLLLSLDGMNTITRNNLYNANQYKAIDRLNSIAGKTRRMQLNSQNFTETGKEYYLEVYKNSLQGIPGDIDSLVYYYGNNSASIKTKKLVFELIADDTTFSTANRNKLGIIGMRREYARVNARTDTLRTFIIDERDKIVHSAQGKLNDSLLMYINIKKIIVFSIFFQFLLIIFLFNYFIKDLRRRKEAENFTATLNKQLETKVTKQDEEIRSSEQKYHDMLVHSPVYITNTDLNGKIVFINPAFAEIMEYESIEAAYADTSVNFYKNPEDRARFLELLHTNGRVEQFEVEIVTKKSKTRAQLLNAWLSEGIIHTIAVDITERKQNEEKIGNLNRIYRILSSINETIIHTTSRQNLFDATCEIALEKGGFIMAWIAILDEKQNKVLPAASAGVIDSYLTEININLNDPIRRQGNIAKTILTGTRQIALDIANNAFPNHRREIALKHGYRSLGSFPIRIFGETIGALVLYSNKPNFFDNTEIELLDEVVSDISFALEVIEKEAERKKYLEELQQSEGRFRSTLNGILEGFQILGFDWRYLYINSTAEKHNRRPKEELLGKVYADMWPGIEKTRVYELIKNCLDNRVSEYLINEFTFPSGDIGWFELRIEPVPEGVIILSSDVTEKIQTEEALQENQRFLYSLIENSGALIYAKDLQGKYIIVNKIWEQTIGFTREYCIGKSDEELFAEDAAKTYHDNDTLVILQNKILETEEVFTVQGETRYFLSIKFPLYDNKHALSGICGVSTEITARKATEKALHQRESHYRAIMETANDAIITVDTRGNIFDWNQSATKIFGYESHEIIGKSFYCLAPENAEVIAEMNAYISKHTVKEPQYGESFENLGLHKNGRIFPIELSVARWGTNGDSFLTAIIRDITGRRLNEEKLNNLNRLYRILSSIDEAIIHIKNRQELFDQACHIATEKGNFMMAWIGILDESLNKVLPVAASGDKDNYVSSANIDLNDETRRKGLVAQTVLTGIRQVALDIANNPRVDPWRENALKHGFKSLGCLPLKIFDKTIGAFMMYADSPYFFDETGTELLDEVASNLSFALEVIESEKVGSEMKSKLAVALSSMTDAVFISDVHGNFIEFNDAFATFHRFKSKAECVKTLAEYPNILDIFLPDGSLAPTELWSTPRALRGEKATNIEFTLRRKDTGETWIGSYSFSPITDQSGNIIGSVVVARDITEMKKSQKIILESEERLRNVFENSPVGNSLTTLDGKMHVNKEFGNILGYTAEELTSKSFDEITYPEDIKKSWQALEKLLEEGAETGHLTKRFVHKSGKIIWADTNVFLQRDKDGNPLYYITSISDITDRFTREEELRKLSLGIEQSPVSIIIINKDGIVEYVNKKFSEISGYDKNEVLGISYNHIISNIEDENFYNKLWSTISAGAEFREEVTNKRKSGEVFWESIFISSLKNSTGEITHFVSIQEDVSERKRIMEELVAAKEKAEEMNRVKSNFLANMSHELRTPLIGILGYSEILQMEAKDSEIINMAQIIQQSGDRLKTTLNMILDFSKVEADGLEVKPSPKNIIPLIKRCVDLYNKTAQLKKLSLSFETDCLDLVAPIDEHLFTDMLNNLIKNAIVYTEKGGIVVQASAEYDNDNEWAHISVIDTGIGIDEKDFEIIFEEFRQASEGLNRSFEGTGLGLTLAKKYVEMMRGTISVKSRLGFGSTFTVKLPVIAESSLKSPGTNSPVIDKLSTPKPPRLFSTLYVEDDEVSQGLIKKILGNICVIDIAQSGPEALEAIHRKEYELILVDINLGKGMDGIEVTKKVREIPSYRNTPIIAVTAYAMPDDKAEFLAAGCTDYISKPFSQQELVHLLKKTLNLP
jgi:PAS domain S-box-containing protein